MNLLGFFTAETDPTSARSLTNSGVKHSAGFSPSLILETISHIHSGLILFDKKEDEHIPRDL